METITALLLLVCINPHRPDLVYSITSIGSEKYLFSIVRDGQRGKPIHEEIMRLSQRHDRPQYVTETFTGPESRLIIEETIGIYQNRKVPANGRKPSPITLECQ